MPAKAFEDNVFYVHPLKDVTSDLSAPWYSAVPIAKHIVNDKVKTMCSEAGIQRNETNHSLRSTGATEMYQSGIPEKVIQERSGHQSKEELHSYIASTILSTPQTQTYYHAQQACNLLKAGGKYYASTDQYLWNTSVNLPLNNITQVIDICEKKKP